MKTSVKVIGVHSYSEGYPNVRYRLEALRDSEQISFNEYRASIWKTRYAGHNGLIPVLYTLAKSIYNHGKVFTHLLLFNKDKIVYVPYPGIFVVYLMRFLPSSRRPKKLLLDAFISIYDTVVYDRKLLKKGGMLACILKHIESTAFRLSSSVITDTLQNSSYYADMFQLPHNKFINIPLSTNEISYRPSEKRSNSSDRSVQVLFFGTLVPLHGIKTILEAAERLNSETNIQFRIVGDGQERNVVEEKLGELDNVVWLRDWKSPDELNEEIQAADICLGIFGDTQKTHRVCPYKLYSYAQCGKPIITAETECINELNSQFSEAWVHAVPTNDPNALTDAIYLLVKDPQERLKYATNSLSFYNKHLANNIANKQFLEVILS